MKNLLLLGSFFLSISLMISACQNSTDDGKNKMSDQLNIYNWDGILSPQVVKNFEETKNLKISYDLYSSNEILLAKLQSGAKGYDLIFPSDYMIDIMRKQNMLEKINFSNVPNYKNIDTMFKKQSFDPHDQYSIPYEYSVVGIAVDTVKIKNFKKSWDILFDPKYKGQICMLDDIRYGLVPALKKLGYSINTTNEKELAAAKDLMLQQKPLVRAYSSDTYISLLKSGEVLIAEGYTGDVYKAMQENPHLAYFIPQEGTAKAIESMCIPKGAPHKFTAEAFMNYVLDPKVHGTITNASMYGNPNDSAKRYIDKKILFDRNIFVDPKILQKSESIQDVGKKTALYSKIWTTIKSD